MTQKEDDVIRNRTRLSIVPRHQLIDLNKEYINFEILFECRCADASKDFEMLVINQDQLNTIDLSNLVMKKTKGGYISGNIVADEDRYQNYFLVVRADDPVEADLDITIRPIPPKTVVPPSPTDELLVPAAVAAAPAITRARWTHILTDYPFYVFLGIVLLAILVYVGYHYYKKYLSKVPDGNHIDDGKSESAHSDASSRRSSKDDEDAAYLRTLLDKNKHKTKGDKST